ncbi:MAG: transposase [Planctomycetota bacterium]
MPASPHRKRLRRFHEPGDLHELTFATYRGLKLLEDEDRVIWLAEAIDAAGERSGCDLVAYVFMPDHVHLLVRPTGDQKADISRFLKLTKGPFARRVHRHAADTALDLVERLTVRERPGKSCFRFWQEGAGYDRNLRTPAAIGASIDYLHANPVRRGLCDRPTDWRWSSARFYADDGVSADGRDSPRITRLPFGVLQ